jgi:hypothetical protein
VLKISCQEPAESSKVKVKTEKAAKTKGDKGDKAKAKVSKDKLKSKAEKKPKAEKAEKLPKAQGPRDTLDWPKGLSSPPLMRMASGFLFGFKIFNSWHREELRCPAAKIRR